VIRFEGVTKAFGRPVLRGVNLDVPTGALYGLVGPGAAGKTSLLKVAASLVAADGGAVRIDGRDVARLTPSELVAHRLGIGMVFQNNALFDHMTVAENIAFPLRRRGERDEALIRERVAERLERVGLGGFQERQTAGLSGGQKKRVGIARATIADAPVLLYDEPAAGLDPVTSQRIFDLLRTEQRRAGATALMVSSDVDRLVTVTDFIGMMHEGRIVFQGTTAEARTTSNPFVRQFLDGSIEGPL
jgi:phospholipid/cholesterol/gamma-HCH transport system ATP-binding protein